MRRDPPTLLTDGVVTVRPPHPDDIERLKRYGGDETLLQGVWAGWPQPGESPADWAARMIQQWRDGWSAQGSIESAGLIVDEKELFVGLVVLIPMSEGVVELVYGVVPPARGRGIAARAAQLVAKWALDQGGFEHVELRIGENHAVSRSVAEKAGFRFVERFETYVTGTGQVAVDVLYVRTREPT